MLFPALSGRMIVCLLPSYSLSFSLPRARAVTLKAKYTARPYKYRMYVCVLFSRPISLSRRLAISRYSCLV